MWNIQQKKKKKKKTQMNLFKIKIKITRAFGATKNTSFQRASNGNNEACSQYLNTQCPWLQLG